MFLSMLQFCVVIAVVFILEVVAGVLAVVLMGRVKDNLLHYMKDAMVKYEDSQDMKAAVDYVQKRVSM